MEIFAASVWSAEENQRSSDRVRKTRKVREDAHVARLIPSYLGLFRALTKAWVTELSPHLREWPSTNLLDQNTTETVSYQDNRPRWILVRLAATCMQLEMRLLRSPA
jgi:hypothetical protein